MLQQALQKLQAEIADTPNNEYIAVVGGFMAERIRNHPEDAEKVMAEGKTIDGSLKAMWEVARKNQSNGVGRISHTDVLKYYDIAVPEADPVTAATPTPTISTSLDDLF